MTLNPRETVATGYDQVADAYLARYGSPCASTAS